MTDADEMKALLTYANYAKVGRALGVSKTIVAEWAKGEKVNPHRLQQVRDLIRPPAASEGPPSWVKRLLAGVMALEERDGISDASLAKAQARAAAHLAVVPPGRPRRAGGGGSEESAA